MEKKEPPNKKEKICNLARHSISKYCMQECNAYCCRKGFINITKEELKFMNPFKKNVFTKKINNDMIRLSFEDRCPSLNKDNKCMIHDKPKRPLICHEFPIILRKNVIFVSSKCSAVMANKLFPHIKKLIELGCVINYF